MAMTTLDFTGGGGRPITADLVTRSETISHGVVMLPGVGYTCAMPAFYYVESMALNCGAAVLSVDAVYRGDERFRAWPLAEDQRTWQRDDVRAAIHAMLDAHDLSEVTVVAKSLTTIGLAGVNWSAFVGPGRTLRLVWLTPLLRDPGVVATLTTTEVPSLVSIGTTDHVYDEGAIARLRDRPNVTLDIIDGADHSYGHGPDIDQSLASVGQVVRSVRRFAFGAGFGR